MPGGWSTAVEEAIKGELTGYKPKEFKQVYFEEVSEGFQLPQVKLPITVTRCVYLASATRDFSPQHSNRDYAQGKSKTKDMFVNTQFNMGMVSRLITDWAGPDAFIRRLKIAMRGNVCAGDDMILDGKVTKKYQKDGANCIDLEIIIATQAGPTTPCEATVLLPSKEAATKKKAG